MASDTISKFGVLLATREVIIEPALKRVGRLADGWLNDIADPNIYKQCLEKIRSYAAEAGRDPQAIEPDSISLSPPAMTTPSAKAGTFFRNATTDLTKPWRKRCSASWAVGIK